MKSESQEKGAGIPPKERYEIMLPCEPNRFAEFISTLLGRPQEIAKIKLQAFRVEKQTIENAFHLVDQRVNQQNASKLIQFTVTIFFGDGSSTLLNSLSDFLHYNEIRPVVSDRVLLQWSYLIQFPDRSTPEKQEIELFFGNGEEIMTSGFGFHVTPMMIAPSGAGFRIKHTARTWGGDIESLLDNHLDSIAIEENLVQKFIAQNSGWIGLVSGSLVFVGMLIAAYRINGHFLGERITRARDLMAAAGPDILDRKVNLIIDELSSGFWQKYTFGFGIFVLASFVFALVFGIVFGSFADNRRKTQVRLTRKAEEAGDRLDRKWKCGWRNLVITIIVGAISGIVGNYLYSKLNF